MELMTAEREIDEDVDLGFDDAIGEDLDEITFDPILEAAIAQRISKRISQASGDDPHAFWQDGKLGVSKSGITLEAEQVRGVRGIYDALKHGKIRLYMEAATGWGKTVAIMKLQELLRDGHNPAKTLVVCNDLNDMWRWESEYEKHQPELGKPGVASNVYVSLYYGDEKRINRTTITTYNSFVNAVREGVIGPNDFDLIVLDEGHKSLSELRKDILNKMESVQIALSATPAYSREKTLAADYVCAYECSPERSEELGLIAPFESVIIKQPRVTLDRSVVLDNGEYSKSILRRKFDEAHVTKSFLDWYKTYIDKRGKAVFGRKGIVNCLDVDHAKDVATEINKDLGHLFPPEIIPAFAITGDTKKGLRKWAIEEYKKGNIKILTGKDIFIHGFHDSSTDWVFNIDATTSGVKAGQRGGRARSKDRSGLNPDKIAIIAELLYENTSPYGWQLLYEEWAGRRMFNKSTLFPNLKGFWGEAEKTAADEAVPPKAEFNWGEVAPDTVIDDPEEIQKLIQWRAAKWRELKPRPHWTTRFPDLWPSMNARGMYTGIDLFEQIRSFEPAMQINRLQNVLTGKVDHFNPERYVNNWNPVCFMVSKALGKHVSDLFPVPEDWGDKPRMASPEKHEYLVYRERARVLAEKAGFPTLVELARFLNVSMSGLNNTLKKRTDNFKRNGEWNDLSKRLAESLMVTPEKLFGVPERVRDVHTAWRGFAKAGPAHLPELEDVTVEGPQDPGIASENERVRVSLDRMMLRLLTPRQQFVLAARYGLGGGEVQTLEDVAQKMGVTRERIRQMELKALNTLGHRAYRRELNLFMDIVREQNPSEVRKPYVW